MNELLVVLDVNAKTALYEQIYEYMKDSILDGRLSKGERLPSARLLAANLQVSRSTVDTAYAQLVSEGYLQAKRGSGYYVCDISALYHFTRDKQAEEKNQTGSNQNQCGQNMSQKDGLGISMQGGGEKQEVRYNFLPGQIDTHGFAYNAWRRSAKEALLDMETGGRLLAAGHPQGEYELRRTIAAYLYQSRGVCCEPEQMIIGAGNEYLLLLLGQMLGRNVRIAMESPTYLQAYHTFRNMGYSVEAVPMDDDGMRVEDIAPDKNPQEGSLEERLEEKSAKKANAEQEIRLVYVMPSHQFPLGCVMPLRRRLQLLAWAKERPGRYIIEDDHDSEFRYKGRPIPSLQGIARQENVIYLGTFSNSIMPSVRISYMILPWQLLSVYRKKCGFYTSTVSRIQQMTVCRFMQDGYFERHLNKMRGIYKGRHDILLQLLKGKNWVSRIYGHNAGLHLVVKLNCRFTEQDVIARAAERGIRVQGMSECYIEGCSRTDSSPILLLGFGNLSEKQIREGIRALEMCVEDAGSSHSLSIV